MGTIAKGMITLNTVNDAYTVSLTKATCVIHADYDGSNPQLDNASTTVTVKRGDKDMAFDCSVASSVGCTYSCNMIGEKSVTVKITGLEDGVLSGQLELKIETDDGYATIVIFTFTVERESTMLDWIQDWEGSKTKVGGTYIMTPKLFVGKKETNITTDDDGNTVLNENALTGVYIGPDDKSAGLYGYHEGAEIFHLNETGGMIGGWQINNGGIQTEDGLLKILSEGTIEARDAETDVLWGLYSNGAAAFAKGNVVFHEDGSAYFAGQISSSKGQIGGWTIDANSLYNDCVFLSAEEKCLAVFSSVALYDSTTGLANVKSSVISGGVMMYYGSSSDYGLVGYSKAATAGVSGLLTFSLGSTNYIAGWTFDSTALYLGTKNNTTGAFTDASDSITIGTNGIRGYNWCIDSNGHASFADDVVYFNADGTGGIAGWTIASDRINSEYASLVSSTKLAGLYLSGTSLSSIATASLSDTIKNNGGISLYYDGTQAVFEGYVSSTPVFRIASQGDCLIAGWTIASDALYLGTKKDEAGTFTDVSGEVTIGTNGIRGYKWRLESDGAGGVAGDKISWDKDGNITFADSVTAQWQDGINAAQMMAYAQMLYRDPEFSTGFNGTAVYLDGNSYVDFSAGMILATLTAYGLMLRGVGVVTKIDFIGSSGSTSTVWSGWTVLNADTPTTIVAASNCSSLTSSYTVRVWFRQGSYDSLTLQVASQTSAQHDSGTYTYYNLYGYDSNSGTSYVDVERALVTDSTAPNSTQKVMKITDYNWFGESDFRLGGFYFANQTRANAKFVVKMVAKIPVGWYIDNAHNAYGTGGKTTWATSKDGTGAYTEYICIVSCGSSGTFSTINHFYLRRQDSDTPVASDTAIVYEDADGTQTTLNSLTWYVAYATVYDASSSDKLVTTIDVNGIYTGTLRADQIIAGTIDAENIETDTVDAAIIKNGDAWGLMKDGSGYLANKNITWDADGNLSLTGKITATSGTIAGFTIDGDDNTGLTNTPFTNDAYIIFRNDTYGTFAGIGGNVLSATSGARGVARFENYSKGNSLWDSYNNYALLVGAQGGYKNCAIYMSGGYVSGLCLKPQSVKADTTLNRGVNVVLCLNTEEITITLPTMQVYDDGYVLLIKNLNGSTVNIKPGQSYHYSTDSAYSSSTSLCSSYIHYDRGSYAKYGKDEQDDLVSDGDATMYVYVRDINVTVDSVTYKGCWVQFKHPRDW